MRVFKETTYYQLVLYIYKISGCNKEIMQAIYDYTVHELINNRFDKSYVYKLSDDLQVEVLEKSYASSHNHFKDLENKIQISYKIFLFDAMLQGYYA